MRSAIVAVLVAVVAVLVGGQARAQVEPRVYSPLRIACQVYQATVDEAKRTGRLPAWFDCGDRVDLTIDGGPGLNRERETWLWACITDAQTGARFAGATPYAKAEAFVADFIVNRGARWEWSQTVATFPRDRLKCWPEG